MGLFNSKHNGLANGLFNSKHNGLANGLHGNIQIKNKDIFTGFGNASSTDGITNDWTTPTTNLLDGKKRVTICHWFKASSLTSSGMHLITSASANLDANSWYLSGDFLRWYFFTGYGDGINKSWSYFAHSGKINASDWNYIGWNYDGDNPINASVLSCVVGRVGIDTSVKQIPLVGGSGTPPKKIFQSQNLKFCRDNAGNFPYPGNLDQIMIFEDLLNLDDHNKLYNSGLGNSMFVVKKQKLGYWTFDETSGNAIDLINNNDAIPNGATRILHI